MASYSAQIPSVLRRSLTARACGPATYIPVRALHAAPPSTPPSAPPSGPQPLVVPEYPPQKIWPPDFSQLSLERQLQLEKKYKRRLVLKTQWPVWNKSIQLLQLAMIIVMIGMLAAVGPAQMRSRIQSNAESLQASRRAAV